MNLIELEKSAKEINECQESLMKKYKDIENNLLKIYAIIERSGTSEVRSLDNLITNYNETSYTMNQYYGQSAYDLSEYVRCTKENIAQLSSNLKSTNEIHDDLL